MWESWRGQNGDMLSIPAFFCEVLGGEDFGSLKVIDIAHRTLELWDQSLNREKYWFVSTITENTGSRQN